MLIFHKRCVIQHNLNLAHVQNPVESSNSLDEETSMKNLTCTVNKEVWLNINWKKPNSIKKLNCKLEGGEVFVPFSWVKSQFEPKGQITGDKEFDISLSYSKVHETVDKYDSGGEFMHFKTVNVENRSRVKCISATEGVPISTQWSPSGYYYPTQIAQFALAHISSHFANKDKTPETESVNVGDTVFDEESGYQVIEFRDRFEVEVTKSDKLFVSLDVRLKDGGSFSIHVKEGSEKFVLTYKVEKEWVKLGEEGEIVYGLDKESKDRWVRLTRDVASDIEKGLQLEHSNSRSRNGKSLKRSKLHVEKLVFSGPGKAANVSISSSAHERLFLAGADWFVKWQDSDGGWPSQITFNKDSKKYPRAGEVLPGWYGAMCQGQALSVLVRAFRLTGQPKYLAAVESALRPFTRLTTEGGVVGTVHPGGLTWYEEYPTQPNSHILNGFMFALLGLYDASTVLGGEGGRAGQLYSKGMDSLRVLLPLYDTGQGTLYDLRHLTMHTAPKGARWDYHSTHINQLLTLHLIEKSRNAGGQGQGDDFLKETAERWRGYMMGIKAPHN